MKRFPLLVLLLCLAQSMQAQLYQPGEVLDYKISYRAKLFPNTVVGTVRIATTLEQDAEIGREVYRVEGVGRTLPSFRWVMNILDRYETRVDRQTLRPLRFESDIREGNYRFRSTYRYDWEARRVQTTWRSRRMEHDTCKTMALGEASMDPVSLYFRLRGVDPATLEEGHTEMLEMVLEDTIRHLRLRFLGREVKKIRRAGTFRTLVFACQIGSSEGYSFTDGSEFRVWISDDRNLIPLYVESPVRVGSVQAYIADWQGLKYPLTSKIK